MELVVEDATHDLAPLDSTARGFRLCLEFDGSGFEGWQRQAQGRTVQAVVEAALEQILGSPHPVLGCGRTDAGTHARGMIASFRTAREMDATTLERALDSVLPDDVGLRSLEAVPHTFHARRDALWKWYRYRILVSPRSHPLFDRRSWRRHRVPALAALQAGADVLSGRHDFASFANAGSTVVGTTRTLHALRWSERPLDDGDGVALPRTEGQLLVLDAVGDGFLYKMVRTLVGTLLRDARSADPARAVAHVLAACDRTAAGPAAPARGLTLMAVAVRGGVPPELPAGLLSPDSPLADAMNTDAASHKDAGRPPTDGSRR